MEHPYVTERLASHHDRRGFSSGSEALDRYFQYRAGQDWRRKLTVPYVLTDPENGLVVGYYTLSNSSVLPTNLPANVAGKLPHYDSFPAILIGRLAVDRRYRGRGFGGLLLLDALQRCLESSQITGVMAVIVDAKDGAARAFYERFGFHRFADHEYRLYLPTTEIPNLLESH